jgi:hypothetical protein
VIELTARRPDHDASFSPDKARAELDRWQGAKATF